MSTLAQYLIVCPLLFLAGFIDAIAGGGGLISLPAFMIAGFPVHAAIGTNKFSSIMGSAVTTLKFGKEGYIDYKKAIPSIFTALAGAYIGASVNVLVDENKFKIIMLVIVPLTALYVLKSRSFDSQKAPFSPKKTIILCTVISFFVGIYSGFYGPGTGTFLLLLLTSAAHMSVFEANGITKIINITSDITSVLVLVFHGKIEFAIGIAAGIFCMAGNYLGSRSFSQKGAKFAKPLIVVVLVIFFVKLCTELFL